MTVHMTGNKSDLVKYTVNFMMERDIALNWMMETLYERWATMTSNMILLDVFGKRSQVMFRDR
jgi:hypothetical protein